MGTIAQISEGIALGNLGLSFWRYVINPIPPPPAPVPPAGPLRPPNWGNAPQKTILQVMQSNPVGGSDQNGTSQQQVNFYFDAVFEVIHEQRVTATKHPVQTGAAISDHAYLEPAVVSLEIGMSDLLDSFVSGQYSSSASKSVSAYQTFIAIQATFQPITLVTRLRTYSNMVITDISSPDSVRTQYGLRARITFSQIIPAKVSITRFNTLEPQIMSLPLSARPQDTLLSNLGTKVSQPVSQQTSDNYNILNQSSPPQKGFDVPGAGDWSSTPLSFGVGGTF